LADLRMANAGLGPPANREHPAAWLGQSFPMSIDAARERSAAFDSINR
jgi:hypothetical protein